MAWKTFEVKEFRPGHYVTLIDGELTRKSTSFDREFNKFLQQGRSVDAESVAMALGISTVSAVFITQTTSLTLKVVSFLAFFCSAFGSYYLFDGYILQRIPYIAYICLKKTSTKYPLFRGLQYRFYIYREWLKSLLNISELIDVEFGYLNLALGFDIIIYDLIIWIIVMGST